MLDKNGVLDRIKDAMWPAWKAEKARLDRIDNWYRWDPDKPHAPRQSTKEYKELSARSQTPWLGLVVTSIAQCLYVEGYRRANEPNNAAGWEYWQRNGMDRRQMAIHRAALAYGTAYMTVIPGETLLGDRLPVMKGHSPRRMIAFYRDDEDDWPAYAMRLEPAKVHGAKGWIVRVYDDVAIHVLQADAGGSKFEYLDDMRHDAGVCPVVRYTNLLDLEERADGEVEPFISVAGRINQTTFDRLVVQRFASWVVRTIAGMTKPDSKEEAEVEKLRLRVEDILVASNENTKFGSLPATPLGGFIEARDADVRDLAAVSQTPPHHLLGQMANLSAEALAAAESSLGRKVEERKHSLGESHEQAIRLGALEMGDDTGAGDFEAQVRWRDMESRSLAQTADALGKLAQMLGVPPEMLWEKIPGWTDQDVERAKALVDQGGSVDQLMQHLIDSTAPAQQ